MAFHPLTPAEIDNRVTHHPPSGQAIQDHETWRMQVKSLYVAANGILPEGREKALVFTHLDEVLMWGNAAIARNQNRESGHGV